MECPGSIRLCQGVKSSSSVYAEEGSAAHHLAERCLKKGEKAAQYEGRFIRRVGDDFSILKSGATGEDGDFEITEEMVQAVQTYLEVIASDVETNPHAKLEIEHRFDLSKFYPGMFGTNDACLSQPFGKLIVYDFKYGAGHAVEVGRNPQLLYYALGAYFDSDYDEIECVIVQPRARHKDGPTRRWTTYPRDLEEWARKQLLPAAEKTGAPDAPVIAGTWCKFCPAMASCPTLQAHAMEVVKSDFQTIPLPNPEHLTTDELVKVLQSEDLLKTWLKSVSSYAQGLLEQGQAVPGFKLVRKRANRRWKDGVDLDNRLFKYRDLGVYEKKLLSPAKMEKLVEEKGWELPVHEWIEKPEGGLVIAPESDRRAAVEAVSPAIEFCEDFV